MVEEVVALDNDPPLRNKSKVGEETTLQSELENKTKKDLGK